MNAYKADLHTHTILSPCGDIEMTPYFIIKIAKERGVDIIGITDHNSTLQCAEIKRIGDREGVFVLTGAEVTTKEEVHCLVFVDGQQKLDMLQSYLEEHLSKIPNDTEKFGYQIVLNEEEEVLGEVEYLLISSLSQSISQVEEFAHSLGGVFIPAHIDKMQNSVLSQLGFLPFDLSVDALELSKRADKDSFLAANSYLKSNSFIRSSDAHYQEEIGQGLTLFNIAELSFEEIKKALKGENGRSCEIL